MNLKEKNTIVILMIFVWLSTISVWIIYDAIQKPSNVGYVDVKGLFDAYKGKVEMQKKYEGEVKKTKPVLDTLYMQLMSLQARIESGSVDAGLREQFAIKKKTYDRYKYQIEENNKGVESELIDQSWVQLNQYIKEYGEQHGFDCLIGGTGDGTVLYVKDKVNVTKQVIEYANEKYDGK